MLSVTPYLTIANFGYWLQKCKNVKNKAISAYKLEEVNRQQKKYALVNQDRTQKLFKLSSW